MSRLCGKIIHGTTDPWQSCFRKHLFPVDWGVQPGDSKHWVQKVHKYLQKWRIGKEFHGAFGCLARMSQPWTPQLPRNSTVLKKIRLLCLQPVPQTRNPRWTSSALFWKRKNGIANVYCADHVLQAALKILILSENETMSKGVLAKCRAMVQFFSSSSQKQKELDKAQRGSSHCILWWVNTTQVHPWCDCLHFSACMQRTSWRIPLIEQTHPVECLQNMNGFIRMFTEHEWIHPSFMPAHALKPGIHRR